jgi:hypothetical protein
MELLLARRRRTVAELRLAKIMAAVGSAGARGLGDG